jgi:hypothetical protein
MEIVGVEINGVHFLPYVKNDDSTGYYRAFMHYCINNYFDMIIMTPELNRRFSLAPNDPVFGADIRFRRIKGHHKMYYSTIYNNLVKEMIIYQIARLLRIDVFVHTIESQLNSHSTMEIIGVEINGKDFLNIVGNDDSTGYYRAFMHYCIDRYFDCIIMIPKLYRWFSPAPNDPVFGAAILFDGIEGHHKMNYSTRYSNSQKEWIIYQIARLLRIDVFVHTIEPHLPKRSVVITPDLNLEFNFEP